MIEKRGAVLIFRGSTAIKVRLHLSPACNRSDEAANLFSVSV
jgi:hypothetical protein